AKTIGRHACGQGREISCSAGDNYSKVSPGGMNTGNALLNSLRVTNVGGEAHGIRSAQLFQCGKGIIHLFLRTAGDRHLRTSLCKSLGDSAVNTAGTTDNDNNFS